MRARREAVVGGEADSRWGLLQKLYEQAGALFGDVEFALVETDFYKTEDGKWAGTGWYEEVES